MLTRRCRSKRTKRRFRFIYEIVKESLEIKINMFLQICDAPNALYENGIIKDNEQYSSFLNQTLFD
nr:hypothetical protein [Mycoplasmopsis bovis]